MEESFWELYLTTTAAANVMDFSGKARIARKKLSVRMVLITLSARMVELLKGQTLTKTATATVQQHLKDLDQHIVMNA